jgi:radical SAM superfamily enzyme YgiQ (UPF0313 family)
MKLYFIWPNIGDFKTGEEFDDKGRMEPLILALLAALTPGQHEKYFFDDRIVLIPFHEKADAAFISIEIFTARRGYQISRKLRENGTPVILGGIHASLMPEEAAQYADSVFAGDAEQGWTELLADLENNRLKPLYTCKPGVAHPGIFPDRTVFKGKKYLPFSLVQFSRGCFHACTYCAVSAYFDRKIYHRNVDEVIEEIKQHKSRIWFFVDDNIIINPDAAKELFRSLIPLKIKWVGQCSIDLAEDDELLHLAAKSGCLALVIGFETIYTDSLKDLNKSPNIAIVDKYPLLIRKIHKAGVKIWAAFTIGHDLETRETIEATLQFAIKHKFAFGAFNILMPYPKTPLYTKLAEENRLLFDGKWWLHPDYVFNRAAFIPKNLTPDELTHFCLEMKEGFSKTPMILKRFVAAINLKTLGHAWFFIRMLFLFKTEALKKNFLKLGTMKNRQQP